MAQCNAAEPRNSDETRRRKKNKSELLHNNHLIKCDRFALASVIRTRARTQPLEHQPDRVYARFFLAEVSAVGSIQHQMQSNKQNKIWKSKTNAKSTYGNWEKERRLVIFLFFYLFISFCIVPALVLFLFQLLSSNTV